MNVRCSAAIVSSVFRQSCHTHFGSVEVHEDGDKMICTDKGEEENSDHASIEGQGGQTYPWLYIKKRGYNTTRYATTKKEREGI